MKYSDSITVSEIEATGQQQRINTAILLLLEYLLSQQSTAADSGSVFSENHEEGGEQPTMDGAA